MNKLFFLTLMMLTLAFTGCKQGSQNDQDSESDISKSRQEVMKIHDDSMAEIGKLRQLTYDLEELSDNDPDSIKIKSVLISLKNADEAMMEWMAGYKEPSDNDELISYFESEKIKITAVADSIYSSIDKAKSLLNE